VSLLWRNHLRIGLCPDRLLLASYHRGLKPARARQDAVAVKPLNEGPQWRAPLEAIPSVFADLKSNPEVSVVLADQFVRYALLPWNETLKTEEQWLALARHRFTGIYGAAAAGWDVKVTETSPKGPRLACGLEPELLEALAATFVKLNVSLVSVQPFLVNAFNRINAKTKNVMGDGTCWLLVEEPGRLTLALLLRGVWTAIRSRRIDPHWRMVLPQILQRESAFLGLEQPCTSLVACTQSAFDPAQYQDWNSHAVDYRDLATAWG
jgi:hypothetical protein